MQAVSDRIFHPLPIEQIPTSDGKVEEATVVLGVPGLFDFGVGFVPAGSTLHVGGWILDRANRPCSSVWLCVDGQRPVRAVSDFPSPEVARENGLDALAPCAFEGDVPLFGSEIGPHTLQVVGISAEGAQVRLARSTPFYVIAPVSPIAPRFPGRQYGFRTAIETFDTKQTGGLPRRSQKFRRSIGSVVRFGGWAADEAGKHPVGDVYVRIGRHFYPTSYGHPRPDVASAFGNASLLASGFEAIFSTEILEPGPQNITLVVAAKDGTCVGSFRPEWTLELYAPTPMWSLSSKLTHESLPGRIDEIVWQTGEGLVASKLLLGSVPIDATVTITGWVSSDTSRQPGGAFIETTHGRRFAAQLGGSAGESLGGIERRRERFRATIDAKTLGLGTHVFHLCAIGANRRTIYPTHAMREVRVVSKLKVITELRAVDKRFINRDPARLCGRLRRVGLFTIHRTNRVKSENHS